MQLPKQNFKCFIFPHSLEYFIGLHHIFVYIRNQECFPVLMSQTEKCLEHIGVLSLQQDKTQVSALSVHSDFHMHGSPTTLWAVWMPEGIELKLHCIPDYSKLLHSLDTVYLEFRWLKGKLDRIKGCQSKKWWQMDLLNWLAEVVFKYTFLKNKHVPVRPEGTLMLIADPSSFSI